MIKDYGIFSEAESDLINAARLVLADGVQRLMGREALFPTNRDKGAMKGAKERTKGAREAIVDKLVADYGSLRYEVAVMLLIDAQGRMIDMVELPQGGATECSLPPRIIADHVIRRGASAILLAHNHPSGDNSPSQQDVEVTAMMRSWLAMMDCHLIDHLVLNGVGAASITGDWL